MLAPASGSPNDSSGRTWRGSRPKRSGSGDVPHQTPGRRRTTPDSRPTASDHAPSPPTASATDTTAPTQTLTWSTTMPLVLAELALQQRGRGGHEAVHRARTGSAAAPRRWPAASPMAAANDGAATQAAAVSTALARTEIVVTVGGDGRRVAGPPHDREAHPELVEAQDRQQRHERDGVGAELLRAEQPRQHDADRHGADPGSDGVGHAPASARPAAARAGLRRCVGRRSPSPSGSGRGRAPRADRAASASTTWSCWLDAQVRVHRQRQDLGGGPLRDREAAGSQPEVRVGAR